MAKVTGFLANVKGLGPKKASVLLAGFGSEKAIKAASPAELRMYVTHTMASRIHSAALLELGADVPSVPTGDAEDHAAAV